MIICVIVCCCCIQSCDTTDYSFTPEQFAVINDSLGTTLVNQCSRPSPEDVTKFFNLSTSEVETLHENFKKVYTLQCSDTYYKDFRVSDTIPTIYQYVGMFVEDKKQIYINAFPTEIALQTQHPWKRQPLVACDGGKHFWGVVFDLQTERFSDLYMNHSL